MPLFTAGGVGLGLAVAGAVLVGNAPTVSPPPAAWEIRVQLNAAAAVDPADVFAAAQAALDLGGTQFAAGVADFAEGNLAAGLGGVVGGAINTVVAVPSTLFLGTTDALLGGSLLEDGLLPVLVYPPSPCDNVGDLVSDLQAQFQLATDHLVDGIQQLAAGAVSEALYHLVMSPTYLFVEIPEHVLLDSLSILLAGAPA